MPKSQIIKDIVEDRVSIEKSLLRILVLAKDIKNKELEKWAEQEINGYNDCNDVPVYRKVKCGSIRYSGINGGFQVKHMPLPLGMMKAETLDKISDVTICEGMKSVSEMAESKETLSRDLSFLASEVFQQTEGKVTCTSIEQVLPNSIFQGVVAAIKSRMISTLYELETIYGNLDELGIDISGISDRTIRENNKDLNSTVLNINIPNQEKEKEKWYSKIAWNIITPIITAIVGGVATAIIMALIGF